MIPAYARQAHRRLRKKLAEITQWNEESPLNEIIPGDSFLGIITSGICYAHVREAAPRATVLKLAMTYPLPLKKIRTFVESVDCCVVIEEGDPYLVESIRAAGLPVEGKPEMFRFGELMFSGSGGFWTATLPRKRYRPAAPPRSYARDVRIALFLKFCGTTIAWYRAISAVIRWEFCRPLRRWTPASVWGPVSGWGWGCGMFCRRNRPGKWSA